MRSRSHLSFLLFFSLYMLGRRGLSYPQTGDGGPLIRVQTQMQATDTDADLCLRSLRVSMFLSLFFWGGVLAFGV